MAYDLHKKGVRNSLKARREPYWGAPIDKGRYLGYRKIDEQAGTWIARLRDDEGKQHYKSLGPVSDQFEHTQAKKAAAAWFGDFDAGVASGATVTDACRAYCADLRADDREKAAHDAEKRFERTVYGKPFGRIRLDKLRTAQLKAWRAEVVGDTPSNQNRYMTALRAALNFAVIHRMVNAAAAIEWKSVKAHKNADKRRELFLDRDQRQRLIEACTGSLRDLVEAAALSGARPGELAALKAKDFDAREGLVTFNGKTGKRTVPVAAAAVELFKRLSRSKLPEAPLIDRGDGNHFDRWAEDLKEAVKRAKLPTGVVLYSLRHSFITECLTSGMSTLDVARLCGTSLVMLERHYGHLRLDSAVEGLARLKL